MIQLKLYQKHIFLLGFDDKELPLSWTIFILSADIKLFYTLVNSNKHIIILTKLSSILPLVSKEH